MAKQTGLVLSGGGARGAYQAGVLKGVQEIAQTSGAPLHFDYLSGVSAGAINASSLAAHCENLEFATHNLADLWGKIVFENVFSTNPLTMGRIGMQWVRDLSMGGLIGTIPGKALLATDPLRDFIQNNMDYNKVQRNIDQGHLKALAITAVDYAKSATATFIQGNGVLPSWDKGRKRSERTTISTDHIMASSAIPLLFPPVRVDDRYFGDGAVRNHAPCSPVIYLGAEKLLVIGVRKQTSTAYDKRASSATVAPSVASVVNTIMNGALMDAIEQDLERLTRLNDYAQIFTEEQKKKITLRPLDYLFISPSADIGEMAVQKAHKLPRMVRFLLKGLGSMHDASEIISYLLFDPGFCTDLVEIGYRDALAQRENVLVFLNK